MIEMSLCMIVKDEEDTLPRCLSSIAELVDEIIIVDTGSSDRTKEVARTFTEHVYDFPWVDDFAKARNYAFELATKDYIMWLDADDLLADKDQQKLRALKESTDPTVDSMTMEYLLDFDEYGNVTVRNRRNRIVKRANQFKWIGKVHEYLAVWGTIINTDVAITHASIRHDSDRNLNIYEQAVAAGEELTPRDLYYYANELKDHQRYEDAIVQYEQFLATEAGWIEDVLATFSKLADCYHALKMPEQEVASSLRALRYAPPRPELCCRMGYYFMQKEDYQASVFWYQTAIRVGEPRTGWGSANIACSTWLPHLQLCVCYDRLGQYELANEYNEIALRYRPSDHRMLQNRLYFQEMLAQPSQV